jgi:hypothetical protein
LFYQQHRLDDSIEADGGCNRGSPNVGREVFIGGCVDAEPGADQIADRSGLNFVNATLVQIQNASRMPSGGISETSVNAVLAFIEAAEPKNEIEAALAIQMACTHAVTMAVLSRPAAPTEAIGTWP